MIIINKLPHTADRHFQLFIFNIAITFISHIIWTHAHDAFAIALTDNQIGAAGATQLADALQRNSTLTTLHLGGKHDMICGCNLPSFPM